MAWRESRVCGGEAQQADPLLEETVLPAVVLGQSVSMPAAVVLDAQPPLFVVQIRPAQEPSAAVVNWHLSSRARQAGGHEQHPQPRLHRRLRLRLHVQRDLPQLDEAPAPSHRLHVRPERGQLHEARMQGHVGDHRRLDHWQSPPEVLERAQDRRRAQTVHADDLIRGQLCPRDLHAGPCGDACAFWDRDLDRVAGLDVEPVQPGGGETGHRCDRRQPAHRTLQLQHGTVGMPGRCVCPGPDSPPAAASQVPVIESRPPGLLERERAAR
jgi:hypothetical protein